MAGDFAANNSVVSRSSHPVSSIFVFDLFIFHLFRGEDNLKMKSHWSEENNQDIFVKTSQVSRPLLLTWRKQVKT